jgi:hypothetical protein
LEGVKLLIASQHTPLHASGDAILPPDADHLRSIELWAEVLKNVDEH